MSLKGFLKNNALVLGSYFAALCAALFFMLSYRKIDINVYLNSYVGNHFWDSFFYYITYFGDGRVAAFLLLAILVYNVRYGIFATFSFLTSTIIATSLKYTWFDDVNRPFFIYQFIEPDHHINYVEGVDLHIHNSFPSGHATQAFAILMCLVFVTKNQALKIALFAAALLTSLSRVYLSQHWLADVTAGSVIGTLCSIVFYYVFIYRNKFSNLNRSLLSFTSG